MDAEFFGQPEPMYERLVLSHVVGGGKMDLQCVSELVALGDVKTTPAPSPANILEPSKCMIQFEFVSYSLGSSTSVHSATKSAKTCDLIARRGL